MTVKQDIAVLLKGSINGAALTLRGKLARWDAVVWYQPGNMQKDYLQNRKMDVLFSVKRSNSVASRVLQNVPHTDKVDYEIAIWLIDSPSYTRGEKDVLRDAALAEVSRIFKANPDYGTKKALRDDDHVKGNVWVLNSILTVSNEQYS